MRHRSLPPLSPMWLLSRIIGVGKLPNVSRRGKVRQIASSLAECVVQMHDAGIIHGVRPLGRYLRHSPAGDFT